MLPTSRSVGEFLVARKVLSRDDLEEALGRRGGYRRSAGQAPLVGGHGRRAGPGGGRGRPARACAMWDPDADPIPAMLGGMLPVALCQKAAGRGRRHERQRADRGHGEPDRPGVGRRRSPRRRAGSSSRSWPPPSDVSLAIEVLYGVEDVQKPSAPARGRPRDACRAPKCTSTPCWRRWSSWAPPTFISAPACRRASGSTATSVPWTATSPSPPPSCGGMVYAILTQRQREKFEADLELDTSHSGPGRRPLPAERLRAARLGGRRPAGHPLQDRPARQAGHSRRGRRPGPPAPGPGAGHRPDRVGQVDDAGLAGRHRQHHPRRPTS